MRTFIVRVLNKLNLMISNPSLYFYGNFNSWEEAVNEAQKYGKGYEGEQILNRVAASTEKVRKGEAVYERDGVCFYEEKYRSEFLSSLLYVLAKDDHLDVLDFGGALGSTYFQNIGLLKRLGKDIRWNVVEQKNFVDWGKKNVPEISFFENIRECIESVSGINCILLSGVLQYLDEPYALLKEIADLGAEYIIIDRQPVIPDVENERIVLEKVPEEIYKAVYPAHLLKASNILRCTEERSYRKVLEWNSSVDFLLYKDGIRIKQIQYKGYLLSHC